MAPWDQHCVRACGRTAGRALGFVGLSHLGCRLHVTDQGQTGGISTTETQKQDDVIKRHVCTDVAIEESRDSTDRVTI